MRLTPTLKDKIIASAAESKDFDAVETATGISPDVVNEWLQRGTRQKTGIYRELVEGIKPFYGEMSRRRAIALPALFFQQLAEMVQQSEKFERIAIVWYNAIWLNDKRISMERRLELARQLTTSLGRPIHPGRWKFVEPELMRRAREQGASRTTELQKMMIPAAFLAAANLKGERPDDPPSAVDQIFDDHAIIRRLMNDILTEDLAGPGWRKPFDDLDQLSVSVVEESTEERFAQVEEMTKRREFLYERLALLSKRSQSSIKVRIERYEIDNVQTLSEKFSIERTKLVRNLVNPARERDRTSS